MLKMHRSWFVLLIAIGVAALPQNSVAQPKKKAASKADIARLEARIEEQQKLIDKLVTLQKQYLQALTALFPGSAQPSADI